MKQNVILCDCNIEEIEDFRKGLERGRRENYITNSSISNGGHGGFLKNLARYFKYFLFPFLIFLKRKSVSEIIGWQQFYAINFAFFCRLFCVKKTFKVVVVNFTYKRKPGLIGSIYYRYMKYATSNSYINYFHVLSYTYANDLSEILSIPRERFIVTPFGVSDNYEKYSLLRNPLGESYTLSIGRSNRDFDYLVSVWKEMGIEKEKLVIISDVWQPKTPLPNNIIHFSNIVGEESVAWLANCKISITAIDNGNICSGDTVLLTGMMLKKPTVITTPSSLSEMYIEDGVDGVCIPKNKDKAAAILHNLLIDTNMQTNLGGNARRKFMENFSRESMGFAIGNAIAE